MTVGHGTQHPHTQHRDPSFQVHAEPHFASFPRENHLQKISIWLLPPEPIFSQLQSQIQSLAKIQNTPHFAPHITLMGGIRISHERIQLLLQDLQNLFQNFGGISCQFVRDTQNIVCYCQGKWNQSCVSIIHRSDALIKAITILHKFIHGNDMNLHRREGHDSSFSPPLCEPHLSYAYGNDETLIDSIPSIPPDFVGRELALMMTHPSSLEGVSHWYELGRIQLL